MLVAISIPIFNTQLEKSRESVDVSNMRAAYAVAQTDILTEDFTNWNDERNSGAGNVTAYYNLATSAMQKLNTTRDMENQLLQIYSPKQTFPLMLHLHGMVKSLEK
ncbi:MAG: hypothetical protein ACLVBP_13440 [Ruminococcus sp.]